MKTDYESETNSYVEKPERDVDLINDQKKEDVANPIMPGDRVRVVSAIFPIHGAVLFKGTLNAIERGLWSVLADDGLYYNVHFTEAKLERI